MVWILRRVAGTHVAHISAAILGLDHPVRRRCGCGLASCESCSGAWNIERHPVQHILGILANRNVGIVQDQHEALRSHGYIAPLQRGRRRALHGLREFIRDYSAILEVG